jgi:Na+/pantothenate symporter
MPRMIDDTSDFEKLKLALHTLTGHFSSFEDFLGAFGLAHMPTAQRYGILFGFLVFFCTIIAVLSLLVLGGSFSRITEQMQTGEVTVTDPIAVRTNRPLLLETLLESRSRMMQEGYPQPITTTGMTHLMTLILNMPIQVGTAVHELTDEDNAERAKQAQSIPIQYQNDYVEAYRVCQDKPGGKSRRSEVIHHR